MFEQKEAKYGITNTYDIALKIFRYGLATVGPVGIAASQFILSIQLLHLLPPASFGTFSFLLVTSQFSTGIWSALFCAPLPVLLAQENQHARVSITDCFFIANLTLAILAFCVFWALTVWLGTSMIGSLLFASYSSITLIRWFARAHGYATGASSRTMASDVTYTIVLLAGCSLISFSKIGVASIDLPSFALLVAASTSLLPFGLQFLARQFIFLHPFELPRYAEVWRRHSSWSLTGVITTEATVNAHAYIVTLFVGPTAFAVLAASALIIRPIGVVTNALTDFERPQMAQQLGGSDPDAALRSMRIFRVVLISVWMLAAIAALVIMIYLPNLIFPPQYAMADITVGAAWWMAVAAIRVVRTPESILLQSAGMFRSLAYASIISSIVSVSAVSVLLAIGGPILSIVGILTGEAVCAAEILRQARRWRKARNVPCTRPALS